MTETLEEHTSINSGEVDAVVIASHDSTHAGLTLDGPFNMPGGSGVSWE